MDNFSQFIVIANKPQPSRLYQIAQLSGLPVQQLTLSQTLQLPANPRYLLAFDPASSAADRRLQTQVQQLQQIGAVVLYNLTAQQMDEYTALQLGLRGLLYRDLPLDRLLLALKSLLTGQLYFSVEVLSRRLDELNEQSAHAPDLSLLCSMTRQERKIIALVAQGARNKEIADSLNISAHTVKAHMATIFRKSQARSRVDLLRLLHQAPRQLSS